jgi:hypothetical protein
MPLMALGALLSLSTRSARLSFWWRVTSQLLHVRVAGAVQSIDAGPPELRTKLFEQSGVSKHFVLHRF